VRCIINLHLMTGQIGNPVVVRFPSPVSRMQWEDGKPAACATFAGLSPCPNPQDRDVVEQFWKLKPGQISSNGRTAWDIITGLENGEVGCLWISTNPVVSMPDLGAPKQQPCGDPLRCIKMPTIRRKQLLTLTSCYRRHSGARKLER